MRGRNFVVAVVLMVVTPSAYLDADIYRWDTGEVIPGTEGIEPGPGVQLNERDLAFASFFEIDLADASFQSALLSHAFFQGARLVDADFSNTTIDGANFNVTGLTMQQLYSTSSYSARRLPGISLAGNDLQGWSFANQNLEGASFHFSSLDDASLVNANLADAIFLRTGLSSANFSGAIVAGAHFGAATFNGFTMDQLAATESYRQRNLRGIQFHENELNGWNFSEMDLTGATFFSTLDGANFENSNLMGASLAACPMSNTSFRGALIEGADFSYSTHTGFTKLQLYSTESYQNKSLTGIGLSNDLLSGWDLRGQNLTNAYFQRSLNTNVDLSGADLRGAIVDGMNGAAIRNTIDKTGLLIGLHVQEHEEFWVRDYDGDYRPSPARPPWQLIVANAMSVDDDGKIRLIFESDPWDSLISFEPGIPVQLGGTLELTFADNVDVTTQIGRTLHIFDWRGVSPVGQFTVSSSRIWDLSRLYTTGEVTLTAVPEPSGCCLVAWIAALASLLPRRGGQTRKCSAS